MNPLAPARQGCDEVLVLFEGRQDEYTHVRARWISADGLRGRDPVHDGHPDVHQDDVGRESPRRCHRIGAVRCLADHLHVRLGAEQFADRSSDETLIVDDEYSNHNRSASGRATGMSTASRKVSPCVSVLTSPLRAETRSRIPRSPLPEPADVRGGWLTRFVMTMWMSVASWVAGGGHASRLRASGRSSGLPGSPGRRRGRLRGAG